MRRGIGVAHVQSKKTQQKKLDEIGAQMDALRTSQISDHIDLLETRLRELATKHRSLIRKDPLLRARFKQLGDRLGVDMLASRNNLFSKHLGLGDYYYQLSVFVIEICMEQRRFTGALVPLSTILSSLQKSASYNSLSGDKISEEDVMYALEKVKVLGSGYDLVQFNAVSSDGALLSTKKKFVRATPEELSIDSIDVLQLASTKKQPCLRREDLSLPPLSWSQVRVETVLKEMLQGGSAWVDMQDASLEEVYWFLVLLPT